MNGYGAMQISFYARISSLPNPPFVGLVGENCSSPSCFTGMYAEVWHTLQEAMNFTFELSPPPDGAWGNLKQDGTWDGIVGNLIHLSIPQC